MKKKLLMTAAILVSLVVIAITAFYVFVVQIINVPTGSMANTIIPGDVVATFRYFGKISRGDIMVFKLPHDPKVAYVQRVIGLPGEEIQIRGSQVFINGQPLPEQKVQIDLMNCNDCSFVPVVKTEPAPPGAKWKVYVDSTKEAEREEESHFSPGMKFGVAEPFRIPAGHYFVMGDSRDNSLDSRFWGTVPAANFISKVTTVTWSYEMKDGKNTGVMRDGRFFVPVQ